MLIDEALAALLAHNRAADSDVAYLAYDRLPLDAADEWGDLALNRDERMLQICSAVDVAIACEG